MNNDKTNLNLFFATPVWRSEILDFIDLNKELYKYIIELKNKDPNGLNKSNINGWHSPNFDLDEKIPRMFVNKINSSLNRVFNDMGWDVQNQKVQITGMWSIINKDGATNARHIHSNSFISAAYYVKAPKNCGELMFHDPRSAPIFRRPKISKDNQLNTSDILITPEDGMLVLFPSYLHHSVKANQSGEERVVISFNIDLK